MSKITIGDTPDGKTIKLDIELAIPSRVLIQANSGGGKSWLLRRLAEQLWGKVQTIIIDPEGEFYTIREKFGYVLVGEGGETPADIRSAAMLAEKFLTLKASAVCDLYEAFRSRPMDRRQWVRKFIEALLDAPRSMWHPLIVIIDESHKFAPQESPKAASMQDREIIGGCKDAMIALSTTGRKRGFCLLPGQQIITTRGLIPIENIGIGDEVLTHQKRFRKVTATSSRMYDGTIYAVRSQGNPVCLMATAEHWIGAHIVKNNGAGSRVLQDFAWLAAESVIKGESKTSTRLFCPILDAPAAPEVISVEFDPRNRPATTARGQRRHKSKTTTIKLTAEFATVAGWYLAEGHIPMRKYQVGSYRSGIIFTLGTHEPEHVAELRSALTAIGFRNRANKYGSAVRVKVSSRGLAELMGRRFGEGAASKRIPIEIMRWPADLLRALLASYLQGDGWRQHAGRAVASTVSRELAICLKLVGDKLGYYTSVSWGTRAGPGMIQGRRVTLKGNYQVCFSEGTANGKRLADGSICRSVAAKSPDKYRGPVYDIQVEEDESYCTISHVVHNCPIWATQRLAKLDKDASAEFFNRLVGMTIEDVDVDRAADLMSVSKEEKSDFRHSLRMLTPGQFYAFGRAISIDRVLVNVGPVETHHPETGAAAKHSSPPPMPAEVKAFLPQLADLPKEAENKIKTEAELRAEVRELKKQLAAGQRTVTQKIDRPVPVADPRAIERAVKAATAPLLDRLTKQGKVADAARAALTQTATKLLDLTFNPQGGPFPEPPAPAPSIPRQPIAFENGMYSPGVRTVGSLDSNGDGTLSGPEQRILNAIAWLNSIGVDQPEQTAAAFLAGYTHNTGSWNNARGKLNGSGLVRYLGDRIELTDTGRTFAQAPEAPLTTDEVQRRILQKLPGPERKMLSALLPYREGLTGEQLAELAGYTVNTGSYNNARGRLRSLGLVEYQGGKIVPKSLLYLEP
jgi:hypothetical protein